MIYFYRDISVIAGALKYWEMDIFEFYYRPIDSGLYNFCRTSNHLPVFKNLFHFVVDLLHL